MSSADPFSERFDSISIEHTRTRPESISASLEQMNADAPGFYLLDDASGRFVIDREFGVVSVAHDNLIVLEAGAIHAVRVMVIEPSGDNYELRLRLRMTGRVPQIVGSQENETLAVLATPAAELLAPVRVEPARACVWSEFAAFRAKPLETQRLWGEYAAFGTLLDAPPLAANITEPGELSVGALPMPTSAHALWQDE